MGFERLHAVGDDGVGAQVGDEFGGGFLAVGHRHLGVGCVRHCCCVRWFGGLRSLLEVLI